jgi:peptidoglycan/LPS O-acetylase OafA/YrhL
MLVCPCFPPLVFPVFPITNERGMTLTPAASDRPLDKLVLIASQTVTVPLLSVGVMWAIMTLMSDLTLSLGMPTGFLDTLVVLFFYSLPAGIGFLVGYARCARQGLWYQTARHVWKLPVACLALLICQGLLKYGRSDTVRSYLAPGGLLIVATMPAVACCFYSLGADVGRPRNGPLFWLGGRKPDPPSVKRRTQAARWDRTNSWDDWKLI